MDKEIYVPVWEKFALNIEEAAVYFGVSSKKLRFLVQQFSDIEDSFVVHNGNKVLIKRAKFENYLNQVSSI